MFLSFDERSLLKHAITLEEVLQVLSSDLSFAVELPPSKYGNLRTIVVGWTYSGRVLEIGIEYLVDCEHVFHAMGAGKRYRAEFERRLGYGD